MNDTICPPGASEALQRRALLAKKLAAACSAAARLSLAQPDGAKMGVPPRSPSRCSDDTACHSNPSASLGQPSGTGTWVASSPGGPASPVPAAHAVAPTRTPSPDSPFFFPALRTAEPPPFAYLDASSVPLPRRGPDSAFAGQLAAILHQTPHFQRSHSHRYAPYAVSDRRIPRSGASAALPLIPGSASAVKLNLAQAARALLPPLPGLNGPILPPCSAILGDGPGASAPRIGIYLLHHAIGKGSYGSVYLGSAPDGSLVAIKRLPLFLKDAKGGKRANPHVVSELSSLGRVKGVDNVVQLRDVLYTSNNANLVLEYRHGIDILRFMESRKRNLFARLAPEDAGSMPEQFVRSIARDVLHALVGIHARGLMHRDVKLDNILISPHSGTCDVIDFNLASPMFQEGTAEELVYTKPAGSLHYCAPSILQTCIGKGPGYSARGGWLDVYSLGVACYAMLVGRFPFPGQSAKDILAAHTKKGGRCFGGETAPAGVSSLAINFIETCVDVGLGLKADEALMHPWLAEF